MREGFKGNAESQEERERQRGLEEPSPLPHRCRVWGPLPSWVGDLGRMKEELCGPFPAVTYLMGHLSCPLADGRQDRRCLLGKGDSPDSLCPSDDKWRHPCGQSWQQGCWPRGDIWQKPAVKPFLFLKRKLLKKFLNFFFLSHRYWFPTVTHTHVLHSIFIRSAIHFANFFAYHCFLFPNTSLWLIFLLVVIYVLVILSGKKGTFSLGCFLSFRTSKIALIFALVLEW